MTDPVVGNRQDLTVPIALPDGRVLSYRAFGDPAGRPVIALHGTPGSRLKYAGSHEAAVAAGLRLISVDRWGYGHSSPRPGATLADFATDIAVLADALGLDRFCVTGVSGGGPFAAAVAAGLPGRVTRLALVSPVGILDGPGGRSWLSPFHTVCFRLVPRVPGAIAFAFQLFRAGLACAPHTTMRLALSRAPAVDRLAIAEGAIRDRLIATFRDGLSRRVAGPVGDMNLFAKPWGFDPAAITAATRIWIGTDDANVPLAPVMRLVAAIPGATLDRRSGEGHLWIARHSHVVMDWLAEPMEALRELSPPALSANDRQATA